MNITNAGLRGHKPTGIVIHNDAGSSGAKVSFYENWLLSHNPENGFAHVYIAEDGRLQASDFANKAWHCANSYGNANYASWEVCQSEGDLNTFLKNEQKVFDDVAKYMKEWGLEPNSDTVKLHRELSATSCPRRSVEAHGGTVESCRQYFITEIKKRMSGQSESVQSQTEITGELEMFLINCKDTKNWYVCDGVSAKHIKTTRMLGGFQGKFGVIKLPETVMFQAEFEAEYGKVK